MAQRRGSAEIFWTKGSVENEVGRNRLCERGVRSWELRGSCSRREKDADRSRNMARRSWHNLGDISFFDPSDQEDVLALELRRIKGKKFRMKRGFRRELYRDMVVQARECGLYFLLFIVFLMS